METAFPKTVPHYLALRRILLPALPYCVIVEVTRGVDSACSLTPVPAALRPNAIRLTSSQQPHQAGSHTNGITVELLKSTWDLQVEPPYLSLPLKALFLTVSCHLIPSTNRPKAYVPTLTNARAAGPCIKPSSNPRNRLAPPRRPYDHQG